MNRFRYILGVTTVWLVLFSSCDESDAIVPFDANFATRNLGITESTPSVNPAISFSRPAPQAGSLIITLQPGTLTYGASSDFYTVPALVNDSLVLPYNASDQSVNFELIAGDGLNIQQDEEVFFNIQPSPSNFYAPGSSAQLTVSFSENFTAVDGTLEFDAGGAEFEQVSFVDLSKASQMSVNKHTWDLGFYTETNAFYVILNSAAYTMARPLDTSDLTAVTVQDTLGFGSVMTIPPPNFDPSIGSVAWIDTPDGNLETTAFGEISSTDSENKVFIIKRSDGRDWKKVRVLRNGDGYTLEYANIGSSATQTATISKDPEFNFVFYDLDDGPTSVEPNNALWDMMYGTYTEILNLGGPGADIPYGFNDYIIINRNGVAAAMVMEADIAYPDFDAADVSSLTFISDINAIGSKWRSGGGPTSGPSLFEDRFFVIRDTDDNIYKIRFTRLTSTSGERGLPEFIFERVN